MTMRGQIVTVKGSCLCGEVAFEVTEKFDQFFICHCSYCQKDTGSAFAANLFVKSSALTWLSGQKNVTTFRFEPTRHTKSFCATCGSATPSPDLGNGMSIVPAGSLNEDPRCKPDAQIFIASQAVWEKELGTSKSFAKFPE